MPSEVAFPFAVNANGGIAMASSDIDIAKKHVISAIGTHPGERVMLPLYGCETMYYLFDPADDSTVGLLEAEIRRAVAAQVPEVTITELEPVSAPEDGELVIRLSFILDRTGETTELTTKIRTASRVGGVVTEENA